MSLPVRPATAEKICVIGAGASGLTVVKSLTEAGIFCDCIERNGELGGTWNYRQPGSGVYDSTYLISSKRLTEYADFPIPRRFPEYIHHTQALVYLRAYARAFGLERRIEFGRGVSRLERVDQDWDVTLSDGETRRYTGVVIANGHHSAPLLPNFPGSFHGQVLHASQYKTPDVLAGKRVLIVGAGNSGCDIAVEAAEHASATFHSVRRGYHYLPRYLMDKPIDRCGDRLLQWGLPLWLRRMITARIVRRVFGRPQDYGLPKPDHRLLETHPIINSRMLECVREGRIAPRPDIAELEGTAVRFRDGRRVAVDLIIFATGYQIGFPFVDERHLNWRNGRPDLFLNVFHPKYDNLFVAGLIQPDSGLWKLVDYQGQLIARFLKAQRDDPWLADKFRRLKCLARPRLGAGIEYINSPRHLLEVEHYSYRRRLQKLLAELIPG